ncbi:hypothetical protein [Micromonospora sp. NBC_01796]|uniref:hypothetical protein n=1 Tax=Micromonospora sp. NBC_01796 TaxID=2975987 RepID=UPI002DDB0B6C|nr:hypothetical protein [Micromonospora sp. NBC_01796]WSA86389.1 hypothetical protein OIE47_01850 [Micromonospora sp. NBC_01796]
MADDHREHGPALLGQRWEVGSSFPLHLPAEPDWARTPGHPDPPSATPQYGELFGSGRQALRALVEFGRREYGWTALHLPAYYCADVVDEVADVLPVRRYPVGPTGGVPPVAAPTDAVVAVSYFGAPPVVPATSGATLVVDATHDPRAPWLASVRADYVFASLRKTLPVPDGGALWSDTGRPVPPAGPPTARHLGLVDRVLSAMYLKAAYLSGGPVDKQQYLARYAAGEDLFRDSGISGISEFSRQMLRVLPTDRLRRRRIENAALLAAGLSGLSGLRARAHTLGVVLEFDSHRRREAVRHALIDRRVYPAVLWRLGPDPAPEDRAPVELTMDDRVSFSRRMLFLHTDYRCTGSDLAQVAELVREIHPTTAANPVRTGGDGVPSSGGTVPSSGGTAPNGRGRGEPC